MTGEQIELIKKLMEEAGKTSLFEFASSEMTLQADGKEYYKIPLEFCEVFAELVARDCITMLEKEMREAYGARGDGLGDAIEIIQERYGVR